MNTLTKIGLLSLLALSLGACRGGISSTPPLHPVLDMDFQQKLKAQSVSHFENWTDHRGMRLPVAGTVARGSLPNTTLLPDPNNPGKTPGGEYITENPLPVSMAVLERGRDRFDIFCAICHGYSGRGGNGPQGHGMVGRLWPVAVPNFHAVEGKDNRVAELKAGEIFETISKGKNTMPSYGARIDAEDRWAIIHYVRALQELGKQ